MNYTVSKTVPDEYLDACIQIESSGNPRIKASTSSALGLGQFLNATWLTTVRRHRPDVMQGRSQAEVLELRLDPSFTIEMLGRFTEDNQRIVGMNCTFADLYLAHFLGAGTAKRLFSAPQGDFAVTYTGQAAAKANPTVIKSSTTCGDLRAWAARRVKQSSGRGWVKKYYRPVSQPVGFMAPPVPLAENSELKPGGDVQLQETQTQLKKMNYYNGMLDGLWGSKTSAAISGFINDRHGFMPAPTSLSMYKQTRDQIKQEIDRAEAENFVRPVNAERETLDPKTVAKIAPETVPQKKGLVATFIGFVVTLVTAVWDTIANYALWAWNLFTSNKDNLPESVTDPSTLTLWFHKVPAAIWLFAVAALLGFIGLKSYQSLKKTTDAVKSGER